jgi:hypothetical protein
MMGVAMIVRPGSAKPEIQEFENRIPSPTFRRKAIGGEGAIVSHFTTLTWDGAAYNCVAYSGKEGARNATATMLFKQPLARQDRKMKSATGFREKGR